MKKPFIFGILIALLLIIAGLYSTYIEERTLILILFICLILLIPILGKLNPTFFKKWN